MSVYGHVKSIHPGRSAFNLSYDKKFDGDMGYLYPVLCDEVMPGDTWKIGNQIVIRFQPLVAPIMHEINAYVHYFFVPTRLLFKDSDIPAGSNLSKEQLWENFLSQGKDGKQFNDNSIETPISLPLPRWTPTSTPAIGSLWDYFGFPLVKVNAEHSPLSFCKRCYNAVWNAYYRDENLMDEVDLDSDVLLKRCWEKDYFTSALPWQQRGTAPALPVTGNSEFDFSSLILQYTGGDGAHYPVSFDTFGSSLKNSSNTARRYLGTDSTFNVISNSIAAETTITTSNPVNVNPLSDKFLTANNKLNTVTFDVSDLRLAFQIQKWLERNARGGVRYTEFLRSHFGVAPRDERLQRPEYIGGSKSPIIISEVLQTSATESDSGTAETPQGNLAGHGLTADSNYCCSYHAEEFGYVIGVLSVMPRSNYMQGINRQWLRRTRYDFPFLEFMNLSEQAIEQAEIFAGTTKSDNENIFGYQGRYNELRSKQSMICGNLRDDFKYWHLGREFANAPVLNSSFLECSPRKDIFAVPSEPGLIITFGNLLKVIRPIPMMAEPGLIDHN